MPKNLTGEARGILVFIAMSIGGCGGGGDGSGGDGGASTPLSTPIGGVMGAWQVTETSKTANDPSCRPPADPLVTYIAFISQDGNTVRAQRGFSVTAPFDPREGSDGGLLTGTISGNTLSLSGTNPDGAGTTTSSVNGTVDPGCDSFTGTSTFSFSQTGFSCSGTIQFTATRTLGSGCAGTIANAVVAEAAAANNTPATAQPITRPVAISGTHSSGTDDDWYSFTLPGTTPVTIMLTGPDDQDIDLFLFDNAGRTILALSGSSSANEAVAVSLAAGTYKVKVTPFAITGTPSYTLVVQ